MQAASRLDPLQMAGWVVKKIQEGMLLLAPIPNATVLQRMAEVRQRPKGALSGSGLHVASG
jgi:hypothetical protein